MNIDESEIENQLEDVRQCLEEQQAGRAIELLDEIVAVCPDCIEAYDDRGLAYLQLGAARRAVDDFEKVIGLDPDDEIGYTHLAEALRNLQRYADALAATAQALAINDADADAHYLRGWLFFRCGQYPQAIEDFNYFMTHAEDDGEVEDLLAVAQEILALPATTRATVAEKILRHNGFSHDDRYNDHFVREQMFCPYAHCARMQPARGREAADGCPLTGYACPGGEAQTQQCISQPFN